MQTYADLYAQLGYSSIQLGLNTSALKGFNQLLAHQAFWNDAERQIYTEIMARNTLIIEGSDILSQIIETTDLVHVVGNPYSKPLNFKDFILNTQNIKIRKL